MIGSARDGKTAVIEKSPDRNDLVYPDSTGSFVPIISRERYLPMTKKTWKTFMAVTAIPVTCGLKNFYRHTKC